MSCTCEIPACLSSPWCSWVLGQCLCTRGACRLPVPRWSQVSHDICRTPEAMGQPGGSLCLDSKHSPIPGLLNLQRPQRVRSQHSLWGATTHERREWFWSAQIHLTEGEHELCARKMLNPRLQRQQCSYKGTVLESIYLALTLFFFQLQATGFCLAVFCIQGTHLEHFLVQKS